MMEKYKSVLIIAIIILTIVSLVFEFITKRKRSKTLDELTSLLIQQKYQEFDQKVADEKTKQQVPAFNLAYIILNKEMMKGDEKKIKKAMDNLCQLRLNNVQKKATYELIFNHYVSLENYQEAKLAYDKLHEIKNYQNQEIEITYDTFINKGYKYLDMLLEQLPNVPAKQKPIYDLMISIMYGNANDLENQKKYEELAKEDVE